MGTCFLHHHRQRFFIEATFTSPLTPSSAASVRSFSSAAPWGSDVLHGTWFRGAHVASKQQRKSRLPPSPGHHCVPQPRSFPSAHGYTTAVDGSAHSATTTSTEPTLLLNSQRGRALAITRRSLTGCADGGNPSQVGHCW